MSEIGIGAVYTFIVIGNKRINAMDSNLTSGIIIGIIIGVVGLKMFGSNKNTPMSTIPQTQPSTIVVPNPSYYDNDYYDYGDYQDQKHEDFDYADNALHVRHL